MGLFVAVFLVGIVIYLYLRVKHITRSFHSGAGTGASGFGASGKASSASGGASSASSGASSKRRSEPYDDGVVVEEELYDQRSQSEKRRKIFAKDEGEYVDYEEEK